MRLEVLLAAVGASILGPGALAEVIYDSSSMFVAGSTHPVTSGMVNHVTQAYAAQQVTEAGGLISFAGAARRAQSATVQMRTGPANGIAIAGAIDLTLNFYAVQGDGTIGTLLGSRTQNFLTPGGVLGDTVTERPYFDCTFDLDGLGIDLPDQVYFGVALDYQQNDVAQSINLSLWNYGADPGGFNYWEGNGNETFIDGSQVKVGTDLITGTWGRFFYGGDLYTLDGTDPFYTGLTPNITIEASQGVVPGPSGLVAVALLGVGCRRRRR